MSNSFAQLLGPLARGEDFVRILTLICEALDNAQAHRQARASIVLYDAATDTVLPGAAPNLPESFFAAITDIKPGPNAGSCATAIHRREPVIVKDITNDPLWRSYRGLALDHSLRACGAYPIFGKDGSILGAFAVYYDKPHRPTARENRDINELRLIAGLAIERHQAETEANARAEVLSTMVENLNQGVAIFDSDLRLARYNQLYQEFYRFPEGFLRPGLLYEDVIRHLAERGEYGDVSIDRFIRQRIAELATKREWRNLRHRPDGTTIAIYRRNLPDGGLICTFTDITIEARATFESHRNARLLAATLDNVNIGIRVIDGDKRLALVNQRYQEMFDLPPHILRPGTAYEDMLRCTLQRHMTDPAEVERRIDMRLKQIAEGVHTSEIRETHLGRIIHETREPMPDGGMVNTYADITHIRQTEMALQAKSQLLETSLANMDQGLLLFDKNCVLDLVNRAYFRLFQFSPDDIRPGMGYADILRTLVDRGDYPGVDGEALIRARVAGAQSGRIHHNLHRCGDGRIISVYRKPVAGGGFAITFTDVTNEVRAGEEAKAKSDLLQMTQDHMAEGICMTDGNLIVTNFNRRWQEICELPPDIARPGVSLADVLRFRAKRGDLGPGDVEKLVAERLQQFQIGKDFRVDRPQPNGTVVTIARKAVPGGGFISTYTDVTERWKAERELERKSQLLETMFESVSQGIAVFDADFRLISRNRQYGELLGLPDGFPAIGTSYEEVIGKLVESGVFGERSGQSVLSEFRTAIETEAKSTVEHTTLGGTCLIVHRSRMPNGAFVIALTDVTKMRSAERDAADKTRLLELALTNMGQGIAIHDGDLRLVACNEKYLAWRGNLPAELVKPGVPHEETIRFRARRGDYGPGNPEQHVINRMEKMRRGDIHAPTRLVNGRVIRAQREPMPDGGFVTTYTDITDIKKVESELIRARDNAEAANRSKTEFLANMSHELRTPLNAIIGFSEMMRNGIFGPLNEPRYVEYSANIAESGMHLLSLIDDILDLSKIEVGKMTMHEDMVDLDHLVESCLLLVHEQAENAGLSVQSTIPDILPLIRADSRKIKQVILNLLQNAIKFTPTGGSVRVVGMPTVEGDIRIVVTDTGIGMKEEDIPRALERFGQVEGSLSRRYNGAGLGLPLAKSLMEMHGGTLSISSKPGLGTRVIIMLPKERVCAPNERGKGRSRRESA